MTRGDFKIDLNTARKVIRLEFMRRDALSRWLVWVATMGVAGIGVVGCQEKAQEESVQRVVVRATVTPTARPRQGTPGQGIPRPTVRPVTRRDGRTTTAAKRGGSSGGAPTARLQTAATAASKPVVSAASAPPEPQFAVTTHTLGRLQPAVVSSYKIEGRGLENCRIYLRRYGAEVELVPTQRNTDRIEFRNVAWPFLETGTYEIVVRRSNGMEVVLPEPARVGGP